MKKINEKERILKKLNKGYFFIVPLRLLYKLAPQ